MINLLELTKRQTLAISAVATGLGIALLLAMGVFVAAQSNTTKQAFGAQPANSFDQPVSVREQPVKETQRNEDGTVKETGGTQTVTTYTPQAAPSKAQAPQPANTQPMQPAPASDPLGATKQDGGHIPFTNIPVTPGDPLSYVGTVGQCPFYEMAGDKGCWPPKDIVCNADWSICKYVGL